MQNLVLPGELPAIKSPDALVSTVLRQAHQTWVEIAGSRFAPTRKQISPARFKDVLPSIFLLDVIDGGEDFLFSLAGDRLVRFLQGRLDTGALMSTTAGSNFHERCMRLFRYCIFMRQPVAVGPARAALPGREFLELETLVMPLSNDGVNVTGIMGAMYVMPLAVDPHDPRDRSQPRAFPASVKETA
jgi:hypothetical protein